MNTFMPDETLITRSPEETQKLAARLAAELKPGAVLALHGELGSGKTCFAQGLARALGVKGPVSSPTFILINEHAGQMPFFHVDLYRIRSEEEADTLDLDDYFEAGGVTLIEWAERAQSRLPERTIYLFFKAAQEPNTRSIIIRRPLISG